MRKIRMRMSNKGEMRRMRMDNIQWLEAQL